MHPQTERLFYTDGKIGPSDVYDEQTWYQDFHTADDRSDGFTEASDSCDRTGTGWIDDAIDGIVHQLDVSELVEWMWSAEREVCKSHGEVREGHFDSLDAAARHHIDGRIHEDTREFVASNVNVAALSTRMGVKESELRDRLIERVRRRVRDQLQAQYY